MDTTPNQESTSTTQTAAEPQVTNSSVASTSPAATTHEHRTVLAVLAYFGILVIVPYLVGKDDLFVRFHTQQGLVLLIGWIGVWVIASVLWILAPLILLVQLVLVVLAIIGIVNAVQGKEKELPVVGGFAKSIKL